MKNSRFGLNLFCQFLLAYLLSYTADKLGYSSDTAPIRDIFNSLSGIVWISFTFGFFYGFFRLLGAKGGSLESYYQNFPIGFMASKNDEKVSVEAASTPNAELTPSQPVRTKESSFNWDELFTAKYLRYAGFLLIVSAIFSMLFRIEWLLLHKMLASLAAGVASLIGAEAAKKKEKPVFASVMMLIGFALLEFGVTLYGKWHIANSIPSANFPEIILFGKLLLALLLLPVLKRFPSDFAPSIYGAITYVSLLSVHYSGIGVAMQPGLIFIALATAMVLYFGFTKRTAALFSMNAFAANILVAWLITNAHGHFGPDGRLLVVGSHSATIGFIAVLVLFITHLISAVAYHEANASQATGPQRFHIISFHLLALYGMACLVDRIPELQGNFGVVILATSLLPFGAFLKLQSDGVKNSISSTLLHMSLIFSAIGLFIEAKGPWTAIVFLGYSCGVLWYSLVRGERQTRIFAFGILTASLIKLYLESSELFDSIPGSAAILIVGILLLVLANKMDKVVSFFRSDDEKAS